MKQFAIRFKTGASSGFKAGVKTWWWISKMTLLASFIVVILQWSGAIDILSSWLTPAFALVGLSAAAVLIFITGALSNIYAAIGVMATLSVTYREALILALMLLICHNLIVETIIQRKSGASTTAMVLVRLSMAVVSAVGMNLVLPADFSGDLILAHTAITDPTLIGSLKSWSLNMLTMIPIMFGVIVGLNMVQYILRELKLIQLISKPLSPLMLVFGLKPSSSLIFVVLYTLGLAYGGSIMITERENKELTLRESKLLNTHIAVTHSIIEDTLLFVALGLPFWWMVIPRLILSIICVWAQRGFYFWRDRGAKEPGDLSSEKIGAIN